MNKGYKYYKREASRALKSLRGLGIVKYNIWILLSILASILIIPIPLVAVMNVRLHKNMVKNGEVNFTSSLETAGKDKVYSKTLKGFIIVLLLFLAICAFAALVSGFLYALGNVFVSDLGLDEFFLIFFTLPGELFMVVFLVLLPFIYIPLENIIDENPVLNLGDIIRLSFTKLKDEGKASLFLNLFLMWSKINIVVLIGFLLIFFDNYFIADDYINLYENLMYILFYLIFFFVIVRILAKHTVISTLLYQDVISDYSTGEKVVSGINVKVLNSAKNKDDILARLFSDVTSIEELDTLDEEKPEEGLNTSFIEEVKTPTTSYSAKQEENEDEEIFNRLKAQDIKLAADTLDEKEARNDVGENTTVIEEMKPSEEEIDDKALEVDSTASSNEDLDTKKTTTSEQTEVNTPLFKNAEENEVTSGKEESNEEVVKIKPNEETKEPSNNQEEAEISKETPETLETKEEASSNPEESDDEDSSDTFETESTLSKDELEKKREAIKNKIKALAKEANESKEK